MHVALHYVLESPAKKDELALPVFQELHQHLFCENQAIGARLDLLQDRQAVLVAQLLVERQPGTRVDEDQWARICSRRGFSGFRGMARSAMRRAAASFVRHVELCL